MSGINDVLKGDGCVLKWEMGVPFSAPLCFVCVCVCVSFLFPDCVLSLLQNNSRCCFALSRLCFEALADRFEWCEECEVIFHKIAPVALRPDHMNGKLHRVLPSLPSTKPVSAPHRDGVCSVRWQPGLKHQRHSWMITQYDLFPSFIPHFFSTSPLFLSACLSLSPLKERNICSRPKGDTLNTSSF